MQHAVAKQTTNKTKFVLYVEINSKLILFKIHNIMNDWINEPYHANAK